MIGVAVGSGVRRVSDAVALGGRPKGVHGVEDLPRDDEIPLAKEAAGILSFFA